MRLRSARAALVLGFVTACGATTPRVVTAPEEGIWHAWEAATFERARRENRPILLSVQAGWCHWCHVMNDTTYQDPEIRAAIEEGFVAVRVDSDARPDLLERYYRYGWPATVFLTPSGEQILGVRGHRDVAAFGGILARVRAAHQRGETLEDADEDVVAPADLSALRTSLIAQLDREYDEEAGGWGSRHRYPLSAPIEHAFFRLQVRDETAWRARALFTLERYAQLIDPVFGGMYQYSVPEVWDRPHFEKIVPVQAGALRAFAEAYRVTGDDTWLRHAESVHDYLTAFLRAEDGAFYASQDADLGGHGAPGPSMLGAEYYALDDAGRRALGLPRVDRHVYADTNGRLIAALADLAVVTERRRPLSEAIGAADRITQTHLRDNGLFAHDAEADDPLFYLADQAQMLSAFLALYEATGQRTYRDRAFALAEASVAHLRDETHGAFVAHTRDPRAAGFLDTPRVPIDESAVMARGLLILARLAREHEEGERWHQLAEAVLRACAQPAELRRMGRRVGELVMALELFEEGLVMLSVVGPNQEAGTFALHRAALALEEPTRIVELASPEDSRYPYPGEPAIYLCTNRACSMPVTDPAALRDAAAQFLRR